MIITLSTFLIASSYFLYSQINDLNLNNQDHYYVISDMTNIEYYSIMICDSIGMEYITTNVKDNSLDVYCGNDDGNVLIQVEMK